ncbi:MAG: FtsW/RodA/SpoVE family cell cycle protein [Oscillospiraceae bacterium]|nr:FtsW/RodA/SpoVE family cell cycle protein [Oscillospiraceae bacterium]
MSATELFLAYMLKASKYALILLSIAIIVRCIRSMLREQYEPETWAYIRTSDGRLPVNHWEVILGRSPSADVRVDKKGVSRVHAVLTRNDHGVWQIYDIFARSGVWVNGERVADRGIRVNNKDVINLGGVCVRFQEITPERREKLEEKRSIPGRGVSPAVTLLELTIFQLFLLMQHAIFAKPEQLPTIALGFLSLAIMQWSCYNAMRVIGRSGFEVETLAFYLSTLGMSVAASSTPDDMYKQILLTLAGVILFLIGGWWLRSLDRTEAMRLPIAAGALMLLAINAVFSDVILGARNWLIIGGYSFQPSELVKVGYVYVGAATLEHLFRERNLYSFIAFSAMCVLALALIGDFGTALVFFLCFLVISFMRSGSIATVILAISGAIIAGLLAVTARPYIGQRFSVWGHVWEDVYDKGYQQARAMSAAAAGGLFGKGGGAGWLKDIVAGNTDMVFAVICEEQGLIIALCMCLAVLTLAFFAIRSARTGRSSYYAIASCAAMSMLLTQVALNVFGSLDILPFTGVTFPFVSRGGSSLLSCWMMMAYIKGADNRREASFAVRPGERMRNAPPPEEVPEDEEEDE